MACGSCGKRYVPVAPYAISPVKGTTIGVIKKPKVQPGVTAPSSPTPVAGDAGPANNSENKTNGS